MYNYVCNCDEQKTVFKTENRNEEGKETEEDNFNSVLRHESDTSYL